MPFFLIACGGGGGDGASFAKKLGELVGITDGSEVGSGAGLSGSAATGAPIANAQVYVVDSTGRVPTGQDEAMGVSLVSTDANGQYVIPPSMLSGLTPPFMVRVVGQMLMESGDMGPAVFHAVTASTGAATVNITPLTEAHAALALGVQPALAYGQASALSNVTQANLTDANSKLVAVLSPVSDFSANPNFVSDPLDATPGSESTSSARKHDATLDQLSVTVSNGKITLADRNQDEANYATGPRVEVMVASKQVLVPAQAISPKVTPIHMGRTKAFASRFTTKLAMGCDVETEPAAGSGNACENVTDANSHLFHTKFKDKGMTGWRWLRGWLSDAFETTDLTGVSVSVVSTTLGSFLADDGQKVHRILLKFTKGNDVVMRQLLVMDDGNYVKAYGNQKDFFFYMAARFNHKADASGQYPYYPKYEQGLAIFMRPWFGSQNDVIFGAHITGAGLPAVRQGNQTVNGLTGGVQVNRNNLASGIEVFDRRNAGCSAFAIDTSVYAERNTLPWPNNGVPDATGRHRWRPDSSSCNPMFDFLRYDVQRDNGYVLPKQGDAYTVTLYLDASKFSVTTPPPAGVGTAITVKNADGISKLVLPYSFSYALKADAFALPGSNFNPVSFGFPGVTDNTRANLAQLNVGQDLAINWSRNKTTLPDGTVFGSFYAGRYMSGYDQWGASQSSASPLFVYDDGSLSENYASGAYNTANAANCGSVSTVRYRNSTITTVPLIRTGSNNSDFVYSPTTCATLATDLAAFQATDITAIVTYRNQRARKQYVSDRGRLVATSDTSQVLRFSDLISREKNGSVNFCSAYEGFVRSRQVYVQLSDVNGRQLMEMREVWWDYPNKTPYTGAASSDRPNQITDPFYLSNTSVGKTNYGGERGFVHPSKAKQADQCVPKIW